MTFKELQDLNAGIRQASPATQAVTVNLPECKMVTNPGPTPQSVPIDTSQLIGRVCGKFSIQTDGSDTGITADVLWMLGMDADNTNVATTEPIRDGFFNLPGTIGGVYDSELWLDSIPGGTTYAGFELSVALNKIFGSYPVLIDTIRARNNGSSAAIFTAQRGDPWLARGLRVSGEYQASELDIPAKPCSECFNDADEVATWDIGGLPISGREILAIRLEDGGQFIWEFCVSSEASIDHFIPCGK